MAVSVHMSTLIVRNGPLPSFESAIAFNSTLCTIPLLMTTCGPWHIIQLRIDRRR
jgi:hypothetical protein